MAEEAQWRFGMKRPRKRMRIKESGEGIRSLYNSTTADCTNLTSIIIIIITRRRRASSSFFHVDGRTRGSKRHVSKRNK